MTSYAGTNAADVNPAYGIQVHHLRFLEFIRAPESARLLNMSPAFRIKTIDREDAVTAALQLQRDAGLMSSNLQILGQFVTSLNRMSSEVFSLAVGPESFPPVAVNSPSPVPRASRAANYMSAMGQWRLLGGPRVVPGFCRHHHVTTA